SMFHVKAPFDYYHWGERAYGARRMFMNTIIFLFAVTSAEAFKDPVLVDALAREAMLAPDWTSLSPIKKGTSAVSRIPSIEKWVLDMVEHTDYDDYWKNCALWQAREYWDQHVDA